MDSSRKKTRCGNFIYGCAFTTWSADDMAGHIEFECKFRPFRCFKCNKMVPEINFAKHYKQCYKDSSASPCPAPEEAPEVAEAKVYGATSMRQPSSVQECVTEYRQVADGLSSDAKDVAAQVKVMTEKQQDLEAIVKGQGDVIQELCRSISVYVEKVDKVQESVSGLVNRLEKDAGNIVERMENVDGSVKECVKESKLGVDRLSCAMRDVAVDVAEVRLIKEKQEDLEASLKQQGDLMKELGSNILMNAEEINEVKQGVGTILQRVENVDGLVKEVRALTGPLADQSKIHWYVENIRHHIEKANTEESVVRSNLFVIRGYSARLSFEVWDRMLYMALCFHLCRGPRDSMLQWPFRIPFTLSLIHPNDASKTKQSKITPPDDFPECFEKPKNEENLGFDRPGLYTVEQAQEEGFIENDAVCFALTLHE